MKIVIIVRRLGKCNLCLGDFFVSLQAKILRLNEYDYIKPWRNGVGVVKFGQRFLVELHNYSFARDMCRIFHGAHSRGAVCVV